MFSVIRIIIRKEIVVSMVEIVVMVGLILLCSVVNMCLVRVWLLLFEMKIVIIVLFSVEMKVNSVFVMIEGWICGSIIVKKVC